MPHFKSPQNKVYFIDRAFAYLLPSACTEITDAEADALTAPTPEQSAAAQQAAAAQAAKEEAKADNVVQYLRDHTPAECEAYVQANVTDLASARDLLKKFAVVLCVLAKQTLR